MGNQPSSGSTASADEVFEGKACYYEVLGVERQASDEEYVEHAVG